jgi:hypothetical protein
MHGHNTPHPVQVTKLARRWVTGAEFTKQTDGRPPPAFALSAHLPAAPAHSHCDNESHVPILRAFTGSASPADLFGIGTNGPPHMPAEYMACHV